MSGIGDGLKTGASIVPTFLVVFFGYGLAASVAQMPEIVTLLITLLVFASPAQFAMADVAGQGGGVLQLVTIAVVVNLRFFVMSLTLAGVFDPRRRLSHLLWCHFVSVTTYLTTFFHWRRGGATDPFAFFQGVGLAILPAALVGTAMGAWFGAGAPALVAFAATLILPVYFTLMVVGEKRTHRETAAAILGFALVPPAELVLPGWGLFVVSVAVGLGLYAGSGEESADD